MLASDISWPIPHHLLSQYNGMDSDKDQQMLGNSSIQSFSRILIYCWISREFLYSILFLPDSYLLLDISEVYGFSIFPEPLVSYRQTPLGGYPTSSLHCPSIWLNNLFSTSSSGTIRGFSGRNTGFCFWWQHAIWVVVPLMGTIPRVDMNLDRRAQSRSSNIANPITLREIQDIVPYKHYLPVLFDSSNLPFEIKGGTVIGLLREWNPCLGSIGTGRSYLVKYLATYSYVPFITVFPNKFLDDKPILLLMTFFLINMGIAYLEKQMFHTNGFGSITMDKLGFPIPVQDHGIRIYLIGRAVAQNVLLSNCPAPEILYIIKNVKTRRGFLLVCINGTSTWDEHEEINDTSFSFELFRRIGRSRSLNLVHDLLELCLVHGLLEVSTEKDCCQFENKRVTLLFGPNPAQENQLDMMHPCIILLLIRFLYMERISLSLSLFNSQSRLVGG
ncbi:unnamed protein product [Musa acuminata subsp. malaccensis]|nr:unnamed protein product [Musa acuminata subsp. malaccensis]